MLRLLSAAFLCVALIPFSHPAQAADEAPKVAPVTELDESAFPPPSHRRQIGHGRLFTNDFLADRKDRWHTGSYTFSRVWPWDHWQGQAPGAFGNVLEMRIGGRIMTPENMRQYVPTDRPWAGSLSFGLHTHWTAGQTEFALGGDLVVIGPQTHLDQFQRALHDLVDAPIPSDAVLSQQIGNQIVPTIVGEVGQSFQLGSRSRIRPFAELRAGDESLVRAGADFTFGFFGSGELFARETTTGNRYRIVRDASPGFSLIVGADTAKVFDSVYLPSDRGFALTSSRDRLRAGVHWQGETSSVFYGATWLGKEFVGQRDSQVVGSVRLQFQF